MQHKQTLYIVMITSLYLCYYVNDTVILMLMYLVRCS